MKPLTIMSLLFGILCLTTNCSTTASSLGEGLSSPDGQLELNVFLTSEGQAAYTLHHAGQVVLDTSRMGFTFREDAELSGGLEITSRSTKSINETWEQPWGEDREVVNHCNELKINLKETAAPGRQFAVVFRLFDDGLGFRYEFPEQEGWTAVEIMEEHTEFQLTGDHTAWWIPGDWDIYEHLYTTTPVSKINAIAKRNHPNLAQTTIPHNAVNTPVTMRTKEGLHLAFHEAALTDYAGMTLKVDTSKLLLTSGLVGSEIQACAVKRALPFTTPWRTVLVTETAGELIESKLVLNLNEPNKIGDVSWFTPMKYVGIWWEMHLGKASWDMASGKHGATTENAKRYIDFAAKNNIKGLLVEGWNTGWERWIGFPDREGVFDFVTPYPDYDLQAVVEYGREKGVELIMHHETSAAPRTYDQQMDTAYALMQKLGIHAVKTGYVGPIIPEGEYHHGQWMVKHYRRAIENGAARQVAINAHEPIKATGIRRTYPNAIAREGLRGQEFNAWAMDGGNPPEHLPIVAFTRMLAGPIDFTPGIFNISLEPYKQENQINTTLAQQLALYVVLYSPVQMAADLPEYYEGQPAFQFIRDVAVDWEQSKVLNGEVGDYVTIARQERGGDRWFLGSITDENPRTLTAKLDFLEEGTTYLATFYKDTPDAHWKNNPTAIAIEQFRVNQDTEVEMSLAAGGGLAVSLVPATDAAADVPMYGE